MAVSSSGTLRKLLLQSVLLTKARSVGHTLFSKYLFVTNTTVAFGLAGTGDVINQHYEKLRSIRNKYSVTRTRNQCIQGLVLGPTYHFWYIFLDRLMPGATLSIVVGKVIADQLFMTPICVAAYLGCLAWLEGKTKSALVDEIHEKAPSLLVVEWTFGPMTQLFNFFVLPTRFRVLYDSTVCLAFDAYYSYVKYRKGLKDGETTDDVVNNINAGTAADVNKDEESNSADTASEVQISNELFY